MKRFHMLSFSLIEADLHWSPIFLPLNVANAKERMRFRRMVTSFYPVLFRLLTFSSPWCLLAIIIMMENAGKLHFSPLYFTPFAFLWMPLCRHSPRCFLTPVCCCASIVSLRGGDPVSVGCISSPALYSGGDLDSQSIFPLQLSQQTPKVVSRLFSRSDINLALPFYIKNACIVRER